MNFAKNLQWYQENLVCPVNGDPLVLNNGKLISTQGCEYHIIDGIPIMLVNSINQTLWVANATLQYAEQNVDKTHDDWYLDTLGISTQEKQELIQRIEKNDLLIDPVVAYLIGATNGNTYKHLMGKLDQYSIPNLPIQKSAETETLLDVGCAWGRWSIAAARKGFNVVGIDPSLGSIAAARRLAKTFGLPIRFIVADARMLPFKKDSFDRVFSYSVLQHFSHKDVNLAVNSINTVLKPKGSSIIQMPNRLGIRNIQVQIKRKFRTAKNFEVRYWSLKNLKKLFSNHIGYTDISVAGFFGLGIHAVPPNAPLKIKILTHLSESLRKISQYLKILKYLADSVYLHSIKNSSHDRSQI